MTIANRDLQERTVLIGSHNGLRYSLTVEQGRYRLFGSETTHPSLSAAASHITGGSVNGWKFWAVAPEGIAAQPPQGTARAQRVVEQRSATPGRSLPEGTVLTATYKKQVYTCIVCAAGYRITDLTGEHDFPSLSAAGGYITGGPGERLAVLERRNETHSRGAPY